MAGAQSPPDTLLSVGAKAPKFYLKYLDGGEFYSSDFFGEPRNTPLSKKEREPIVLSFFATWCGPCRKEIPELEKIQKSYPGVRFFLVDVGEKPDEVRAYLEEYSYQFPVLMDRYGKRS